MMNGSPSERPDWFLRGVLAQGLAPPLGVRTQTAHPHPLTGLMPITHKNHRLSRTAPLKSIAGTRIEPSCQKVLSGFTLRFLRK